MASGCHGSHNRKLGLLPSVESTHHIEDVMEARALQQAAGDHAAVAALAVHCERNFTIDLRRGHFEVVERPPGGSINVARVPFGLPAHVEYLHTTVLQS